LRSAQLGIGGSDRASDGKHLAPTVKHHEGRAHIRNPTESLKGDEAIAPNQYQPFQAMIDTGQADGPAFVCYPVMEEQMTSIHLDANAVAIQNDNARFADGARVR
jgi:hypothetical protein